MKSPVERAGGADVEGRRPSRAGPPLPVAMNRLAFVIGVLAVICIFAAICAGAALATAVLAVG